MKKSIKEVLNFVELTDEEKKQRGILGRLYGPCADFVNPTRNGRKYSDELWEKVFQDEIVKEQLANGGIFGELDHPTDRTETCSEKIAICMPEAPKKDDKGHLIAYFDILDTPNGRIAYQLAKYGYKLGISSRGNGEVIEDAAGNESVDPDSYDFVCFDLVITPSVKDARLSMTESLNKDEMNFKKAMNESIEHSTPDEQRVMKETLDNLNIDIKEECNSENCADKIVDESKEAQVEEVETDDNGSNPLLESLQKVLLDKSKLESEMRDLQEKLAVSNAKVDQLSESLKKSKDALVTATAVGAKVSDLSEKIKSLEESLKSKDEIISSQANELNDLKKAQESNLEKSHSLTESLSTKTSELDQLKESFEREKEASDKTISELQSKVEKATSLKESYKKLAGNTVNRYIESKATMLGVKPEEIKNRLPKSYNIDDIDRICEDLRSYQVNISRLPFKLDTNTRVRVTESKKDPLHLENPDDEIDVSFLDAISRQ